MQQSTYKFLAPVREFTLLNSTDQDIPIMWDGETRVIPAFNKTVQPHPKYSDVCHSLQLPDGRYVPGSLTLKDIYKINEQWGEEEQVWSAANAVKSTLGIDVKNGQATSRYAERGISLLPPEVTPEQIRAIAKAGRIRWERWKLSQAFSTVQAHEERNAKREKSGLPAAPATKEYLDAAALIARSDAAFLEEAKQIVFEDNNLVHYVDTPAWELADTPDAVPVLDLGVDEGEVRAVENTPTPEPKPEIPAGVLQAAQEIEEGRNRKRARSA